MLPPPFKFPNRPPNPPKSLKPYSLLLTPFPLQAFIMSPPNIPPRISPRSSPNPEPEPIPPP